MIQCKSNLKNLGTSLEMYSCDNEGRYPLSLEKVIPRYLKVIPSCPSAGTVTYQYICISLPDAYTLWCSGSYHTNIIEPGYPQYDSIQGLIEN